MSTVAVSYLEKILLSLGMESCFISDMIAQSRNIVFQDHRNVTNNVYYIPAIGSIKSVFESLSKNYNYKSTTLIGNFNKLCIILNFSDESDSLSLDTIYLKLLSDTDGLFITLDYNYGKHAEAVIPTYAQSNIDSYLKKLAINFQIDPTIFEMYVLGYYGNSSIGHYHFTHYFGPLQIETRADSKFNIPYSVCSLLNKEIKFIHFLFNDDYSFKEALFTSKETILQKNCFTTLENIVSTDIDGHIISYQKNTTLHPKNGEKVKSIDFNINLTGLSLEESQTIVNIMSLQNDEIKTIIPEFFVVGPSNIKNFQERLELAKMIIL